MAGYNGRRAPNFSQYLDDLNTIPSPYDQALQQQQQQNFTNFDEELAMFTNAEFFDFDKFGDLSLPTFDAVEDKNTQAESEDQTQSADLKFLDFLNGKSKGLVWLAPRVGRISSCPRSPGSHHRVQPCPWSTYLSYRFMAGTYDWLLDQLSWWKMAHVLSWLRMASWALCRSRCQSPRTGP